ncbi:hypothetical protein [Oceanobacillus saliphilus]|uniref:hypothetical protein n=1 Tax=Oceanobacillus saliphilus TaxID=2925834 RepID=UPI00201DC98E|nr:hypothetical protein [Oceanobacillus saliphilus]
MEVKGKETLVTATSTINGAEDFLLHLRVEEANKGIQIQRSLQYIGKEKVLIEHRTPLVSVSYNKSNHDFTGSFISKELNKGDIYDAHDVTLPYPESKDNNIYIHASFISNGKQINIDHVEQLTFQ